MATEEQMDALFGAKKEASDGQLQRISDLMRAEAAAQDALATANAMASSAKAEINRITLGALPQLMAEAGVQDFTSSETGNRVKLGFSADGSVGPKSDPDRDKKIDRWIELGAGEIVKQSVTVSFPKDMFEESEKLAGWLRDARPKIIVFLPEEFDEEEAGKIEADIRQQYNVETVLNPARYENVEQERSINANLLKSFIKKKVEDGAELPLDELGCWYGQTTKITRPKKKDS